jgi:hypothetical protein
MRLQRWVRPLLPIVALRALLPSGFMPVLDDDGLVALGFCPGVAQHEPDRSQSEDLRANRAHVAHHDHGEHAPEHPAPGSTAHVTLCPFVAAGGAAPMPAPLELVAAVAVPAAPTALVDNQFAGPTVLRAQTPRAPPSPA